MRLAPCTTQHLAAPSTPVTPLAVQCRACSFSDQKSLLGLKHEPAPERVSSMVRKALPWPLRIANPLLPSHPACTTSSGAECAGDNWRGQLHVFKSYPGHRQAQQFPPAPSSTPFRPACAPEHPASPATHHVTHRFGALSRRAAARGRSKQPGPEQDPCCCCLG